MIERDAERPEEPSSVDEPAAPSIDELLRDARRDVDETAERPGEAGAALLLGVVVEARSLDRPGRVLVRWRDARGVGHERWLRSACERPLEPGDAVVLGKPANWGGWVVTGALQGGAAARAPRAPALAAEPGALEVRVDGRRVELEGHEEVVLRCGEASITLRRDGRVEIRGTSVETDAVGTNRIKGGVVEIN
jgi:hypothetical protein